MRIRPAIAADLSVLAQIHAAAFDDAWPQDALATLMNTPGTFALVADGEGVPSGFILARAVAGEAEILTLAVSSARRRSGLGRNLVREAANRAMELGADTLFLEVGVDNAPARGLYTGLGFQMAGQRKGYYREKGGSPQDALILKAGLPLTLRP